MAAGHNIVIFVLFVCLVVLCLVVWGGKYAPEYVSKDFEIDLSSIEFLNLKDRAHPLPEHALSKEEWWEGQRQG